MAPQSPGTAPEPSGLYALATGAALGVAERALAGLVEAVGLPPRGYELVTLPGVPWLLRLIARVWPGPAAAWSWRVAARAVAGVPSPAAPSSRRTAGLSSEAPRRLYLYHCYGGAHTSVTCANLHLGRLPLHRRARIREILSQPAFDLVPHHQIGTALCLGRDEEGHPVYCLGLDGGKQRLLAALLQLLAALGSRVEIRPCHALTHANALMRVGGFLSRRLGLVIPGRPLVALGVWLAYPRMAAMVRQFRSGSSCGGR